MRRLDRDGGIERKVVPVGEAVLARIVIERDRVALEQLADPKDDVVDVALRAGGGLSGLSRTIVAGDAAFLGPWGKGGAMTALSFFFVFGVGSLAQPHIAHKYLMARDPGQFRWYPMVMTVAMTLALLLYLTVGVAVKAMVIRGDMAALARPDDAMPAFLQRAVPAAVAGVVFAGVAAAIMSTVNSFLSVGAAALMHELKTLGCRFALDDFGIGMSSFAYLKYLPVDYIKIDGVFVRGMAGDPMDHAIVEAINRIAHILGLKTVAEFVEDASILEQLRGVGVDYAQGYFISKPAVLLGAVSATLLGLDVSGMTAPAFFRKSNAAFAASRRALLSVSATAIVS